MSYDSTGVTETSTNVLKGSVSEINTVISTIDLTATDAVSGKLTLAVTDGYSATPQVVKDIFFQAPNTAPTLEFSKISGRGDSLTISDTFALSSENVNLAVFDQDSVDSTGGLKAQLSVSVGDATYTGSSPHVTSTEEGLAIELGAVLAQGEAWIDALKQIIRDVEISRETAGALTTELTVFDMSVCLCIFWPNIHTGRTRVPGALYIWSNEDDYFASIQQTARDLSDAEFQGASIRIVTNNLGARIGDVIEFYTDDASIGGTLELKLLP